MGGSGYGGSTPDAGCNLPRRTWNNWRSRLKAEVRTDWTREEIAALFDLPFTELVFRAAEVHRANHAANEVQLSTLLSIKTGGCPEDCGYCSQSVSAETGLKATKLMDDRDMPAIVEMVQGVRAMGMETCMTLGMLSEKQARMLADAGLDYYNHNIDTSPERYADVPVNALVPIKGTVLGNMLADTPLAQIDDIEFVRTVAVARITMPESMVRLSAGRESMSDATQALCFLAGANSIFTGDKLLTAGNAGDDRTLRCSRGWA
eukprot:tig00001467_g8768.t1